MKHFFFFFFILFLTLSSAQEATTYYLIRHAEKERSDPSNTNPELTTVGHQRAEKWRSVFESIHFDAIYSTALNRTMQTAQPTAEAHQLAILHYDPRQLYSSAFQKATQGKTVLIVGHSNTTPAFVNAILGEDKYNDIADDNNANLYVVTQLGSETTSFILKIE